MELIQHKTLSRGERRALRMRDSILDAAQRIIAEKGAAALSCEAVAELADVSIQTVYNRVGRKDDLLMALAERALEENQRYMDEAYALTGNPKKRIEGALEGYIRFAVDCPDAFLTLALPPERVATERMTSLRRLHNSRLAKALADGQASGLINPDVDPNVCATTLWMMWNGLLVSMLYRERLGLEDAEVNVVLQMARSLLKDALVTDDWDQADGNVDPN